MVKKSNSAVYAVCESDSDTSSNSESRGNWGSSTEFLLSCIAMSVGGLKLLLN